MSEALIDDTELIYVLPVLAIPEEIDGGADEQVFVNSYTIAHVSDTGSEFSIK